MVTDFYWLKPGQETNFFGRLTEAALKKFQEKNNLFILAPLNLTKGTGNFYEYTRVFININLANKGSTISATTSSSAPRVLSGYKKPPRNSNPTLTSVSILNGATEDDPFTITYVDLTTAADEADADGDAISFQVEEVSTGTLTKGGVAIIPGSTLLSTGESLVWTPTASTSGTLNAFTVKAYDGALLSNDAVQVQITVTVLNTIPVATAQSIEVTASSTYTSNGSTQPDLGGTDAESSPLTCAKVSDPTHGNVTVNSNCSFEYIPTVGYYGADSFDFTVNDGAATSTAATVDIEVISGDWGINDLPHKDNGVVFLEFRNSANDSFTSQTTIDTTGAGTGLLYGGQNDFTAYGGVNYVTDAVRLGKIAHFDGVDDYMSRASIVTGSDLFSISLWFKTTATGTQYIMDEQDTTGSYGDTINIFLTGGALTAYYSVGNGSSYMTSIETNLNDGGWHHVVFIKTDKRIGKLYIDNALSAEDTSSAGTGQGIGPIGSDLYIGRNVEGTSYFDGYIDDLYWENATWYFPALNFDASDVTTMFNR